MPIASVRAVRPLRRRAPRVEVDEGDQPCAASSVAMANPIPWAHRSPPPSCPPVVHPSNHLPHNIFSAATRWPIVRGGDRRPSRPPPGRAPITTGTGRITTEARLSPIKSMRRIGGIWIWIDNARVVITGGASNIGRGIVHGYAAEHSRILLCDIDEQQARRVEREALGRARPRFWSSSPI